MLQGRSPSETANKDYPGRKTSKEPGDGGLAEYYLHQIRPFTSRTIYTRSNLEPDFFLSCFFLFLSCSSCGTDSPPLRQIIQNPGESTKCDRTVHFSAHGPRDCCGEDAVSYR